jgi:hypothetical protein
MRILIETVPHERNRNNQVGDYRYMEDGTLYITVSNMGDEKMEWLVALHEMIEEMLAKSDGITEEQINDYDIYYEKKREMGLVDENSEDGFASDCIYKKYHTIATGCEMILAAQLGVDWLNYDEKVNSL